MPQPVQPQASDRFVGRSHELAVLRAAYREAAAGDARLVLLAGEPGIGKTELAAALDAVGCTEVRVLPRQGPAPMEYVIGRRVPTGGPQDGDG